MLQPGGGENVLPYTLNRTKLILAGLSKAQVHGTIEASVAKKELAPPEAGAMSYMLSKMGYLDDTAGHWRPHLMIHVPSTGEASWGANVARISGIV